MKKILFVVLICSTFASAQRVEVPETITFADMKLHLSNGARKIIKTDIEAITRNEKYFLLKIDRANLYFPIIERTLKAEEFPEDFKFLALQESSLVSDAVSSSNAVGYWQFKKESAEEVGLRVDYEVDERMNIVSSTRGAAKYLRKSYNVLNNWVYTLLAYNLGLGGVKPHVKQKYVGAAEMQIDENMHWYVMRFLAHKLAYENAVGKYPHPNLSLVEYANGTRKTLKHIADEKDLPKEEVEDYNKWALKGRVPDDKDYIVILPIKKISNAVASAKDEIEEVKIKKEGNETKIKIKRKPKKETNKDQAISSLTIQHNKLRAIKAKQGDSFAKLAASGGISIEEFFTHNDLGVFEEPIEGAIYYLEPKRSHALIEFHTVAPDETLNKISQQYGIRVNSIRKKNRMGLNENPQVGRVLWLKKKRPRKTEVELRPKGVRRSPEGNVKEDKPNIEPVQREEVITTSGVNDKVGRAEETAKKYESTKIVPSEQSENTKVSDNVPVSQPDSVIANPKPTVEEPVVVVVEESKLDHKDDEPLKEVVQLPNSNVTKEEPTENGVPSKVELADRNSIFHTVEKGHTLYYISKAYNVMIDSILIWNNLTDKSVKVGQVVTIKRSAFKVDITDNTLAPSTNNKALEDKKLTHIVEKGQTIYSISRIYRVEPADILKWNNKADYNVSIGETLLINVK